MQKYAGEMPVYRDREPEGTIPRDPAFDSTLAVVREGYRFIANRCKALRSDMFETRLLLQRATCIRGEEAARIFYGSENFTRVGAMGIASLKGIGCCWTFTAPIMTNEFFPLRRNSSPSDSARRAGPLRIYPSRWRGGGHKPSLSR